MGNSSTIELPFYILHFTFCIIMGEAEIISSKGLLLIHSVFYFYGNASTHELAARIAIDIARHWNEPLATVRIRGNTYRVQFNITGIHQPDLQPETVWYND